MADCIGTDFPHQFSCNLVQMRYTAYSEGELHILMAGLPLAERKRKKTERGGDVYKTIAK